MITECKLLSKDVCLYFNVLMISCYLFLLVKIKGHGLLQQWDDFFSHEKRPRIYSMVIWHMDVIQDECKFFWFSYYYRSACRKCWQLLSTSHSIYLYYISYFMCHFLLLFLWNILSNQSKKFICVSVVCDSRKNIREFLDAWSNQCEHCIAF